MPVAGCVNAADTDAWRGRPVAELDVHPVFNTMHLQRRQAADGTEIRDYVNAKQVEQCSGQGGYNAYGGVQANANCTTQTMACHNQFFIKNGIVQR
jgi:hypothetical protein